MEDWLASHRREQPCLRALGNRASDWGLVYAVPAEDVLPGSLKPASETGWSKPGCRTATLPWTPATCSARERQRHLRFTS